MFTPQTSRAVVGISIANNVVAAVPAGEVFDGTLELLGHTKIFFGSPR